MTRTLATSGRPRNSLAKAWARAAGTCFVQVHRDIEGLIPVGGSRAQVLQEYVEKQRQRQGHGDDGHGHEGGHGMLHDPAQGAQQGLRVARQPGVDLHGLRGSHDVALAENDAARAEPVDEMQVVGGNDHGHAHVIEALE